VTQIIAVLTNEYALVASDRRLTYATGPLQGQTKDEDECKLVSLCSVNTIAYTGLAQIEGVPTHHWIAKTLAAANCRDPFTASDVLEQRATNAFASIPTKFRTQVFLITGWAQYEEPPGLHPHFVMVTNRHDAEGRPLAQPSDTFVSLLMVLRESKPFIAHVIGQPLREERKRELSRNIGRLVSREIGPKETLRLLVDEIVNTSMSDRNGSVGAKILGCCVPRRAAEESLNTGQFMMIAKQPDDVFVTFAYFEPGFSDFRQYGPTMTCGEVAATEFVGENDPDRPGDQTVQMKILAWPKPKSVQDPARGGATGGAAPAE
jgi:hypothetical protein